MHTNIEIIHMKGNGKVNYNEKQYEVKLGNSDEITKYI